MHFVFRLHSRETLNKFNLLVSLSAMFVWDTSRQNYLKVRVFMNKYGDDSRRIGYLLGSKYPPFFINLLYSEGQKQALC